MTLGRGVLLASIVVAALALALLLGIGAVPGSWQLAALFATCLLVAVAAVLLPASWRTKAAPLVVAFVAAAGVVPVFVRPASQEPARPRTNAHYLADLVAKGPFSETLTPPLVPEGLAPTKISDTSAAKKLNAVQLQIGIDPSGPDAPDLQLFAHMEVYPTEGDARTRGGDSMKALTARYQTGIDRGTPEGFCVDGGMFWTCAGVRGFLYAEVTVSPNPNAYLPFATETVGALLRYGDRMTKLAST